MAKDKKRSNLDSLYEIVKNKKLPILTLDNRWHELLPDSEKTDYIRELEQKVNKLLKKQGKLVDDIKDMKKLKKHLMKDILINMDIGKDRDKKLGRLKQNIHEINDRIEAEMNELGDIPYQIKEVNEKLVVESMQLFYERMESNEAELKNVAEWINRMRDELTNKILLKQELETKNVALYTYMHDILGADLIEMFDKHHQKNSSRQG